MSQITTWVPRDMVFVWQFLQPQGTLLLMVFYQNIISFHKDSLRYHIMMKHFNLKQNRAIDMINVYLRILMVVLLKTKQCYYITHFCVSYYL